MRPPTRQSAKKKAWIAFSLFIRARDKRCVTCGSTANLQAGHYIPGSVCGEYLFMDERNISAQCSSCNKWKSGNLSVYALYLEKKYGAGILQQLEADRLKFKDKHYDISDFQRIEKKYRAKLIGLSVV